MEKILEAITRTKNRKAMLNELVDNYIISKYAHSQGIAKLNAELIAFMDKRDHKANADALTKATRETMECNSCGDIVITPGDLLCKSCYSIKYLELENNYNLQ